MTKKLFWTILLFLFLIGAVVVFCLFDWGRSTRDSALDFEDCLKTGFNVSDKIPRKCTDGVGRVFIEEVGNVLEKNNLIKITNPLPNSENSSPLSIFGQARGFWYFEGSFPVVLKTLDGKVLAKTVAKTQSDWMTEDFVDFKADLYFNVSTTTKAIIELDKDNPSDLRKFDDSLLMPITLEPISENSSISSSTKIIN